MKLRWRIRRKARRMALAVPTAVRRRLGIRRMRAAGDPRLLAIADAVAAAGGEKAGKLADIEQIRREQLASADRIDYPRSELSGDPADDHVVAETVGYAAARSKEELWCHLLFEMVRRLRPEHSLELGTCVGVSAAYLGAALELNGQGRLVTIEAVGSHVVLARESLRRLGLEQRVDARHGRFEDVLEAVLSEQGAMDLVFIDGNHQEQATLAYAEAIKPYLADRAVVVFDDISYSDGMERAWRRLAAGSDVRYSVDLGPVGLCVYGRGAGARRAFSAPLAVKPKGPDRPAWITSHSRPAITRA